MMGSSSKFVRALAVVLAFQLLAMPQKLEAQSEQQTCSSQLSGLNVCSQFVVPGAEAANPSAECCGALQAVQHDCLCSTLRIASRLPAQCNLSPLTCGN